MRRLWLTLFLLLVVVSPCFTGCGGPTSDTDTEQEEQEAEEYYDSEEEG